MPAETRPHRAASLILAVAATTLLTFYRVTSKRGEIIADMIGVLVHFAPYFESVLHALCNAHHLRERR